MRIINYTDNLARLQSDLLKDKPIPTEQLEALLRQYFDTSDMKIREQIFKANSRLIFMVINQYAGLYEYDKAELWSIGALALLKAIDGFDPNSGWKFSTYAKRSMLNAFITETRMHSNLIRPKTNDYKRMEDGIQPNYQYVSIEQRFGEDGELTIGDTLTYDDDKFDEAMDKLTDQEKIDLFWQAVKEAGLKDEWVDITKASWSANTETGDPIKVSSTEIGEMFGVTKQAIDAKKKKITALLKKSYKLRMMWRHNFLNS